MKNDLRYIKTHNLINETFKSLILKKYYKKITVKEISEIAQINRKTFYLHYDSIEDLWSEFQKNIGLNLLNYITKDILNSEHIINIKEYCKGLNALINEDFELHMRLICTDNYSFFVRQVQNIINENYLKYNTNLSDIEKAHAQLILFGVSNFILSMYKLNYLEKMNMTLEEISDLAQNYLIKK